MSEFPVAVQFLDVLGKTTVPFLVTDPVRGVNFNTMKIHFNFIIMGTGNIVINSKKTHYISVSIYSAF